MNKTIIIGLVAVLAVFATTGTWLLASERNEAPVQQDMPQPTKAHNEILQAVGNWKGSLTSFVMGPKPVEFEASETVVAVGGFWTQARFECDFGNMPFVGTGITGFDPKTKKYVGTWADSFSAELSIMSGVADEEGNVTMRWKSTDHATGEPMAFRMVTVRPSKDHYRRRSSRANLTTTR